MSIDVDPDVMARAFCKAYVPESEQDDAINAMSELVALLILEKDTRDRLHNMKCKLSLRELDKRLTQQPTKAAPR